MQYLAVSCTHPRSPIRAKLGVHELICVYVPNFVWIDSFCCLSEAKTRQKCCYFDEFYYIFGAPAPISLCRSGSNLACESMSIVSFLVPNFAGIVEFIDAWWHANMQIVPILELLGAPVPSPLHRSRSNLAHKSSPRVYAYMPNLDPIGLFLSLIHIWRCRRIERCRSRWSPYH